MIFTNEDPGTDNTKYDSLVSLLDDFINIQKLSKEVNKVSPGFVIIIWAVEIDCTQILPSQTSHSWCTYLNFLRTLAIDSSDSSLVWHLLTSWWTAWMYLYIYGRLCDLVQVTSIVLVFRCLSGLWFRTKAPEQLNNWITELIHKINIVYFCEQEVQKNLFFFQIPLIFTLGIDITKFFW